jgi:hypothetical protein
MASAGLIRKLLQKWLMLMSRPRLYPDKAAGYFAQQERRKATRKAHNVDFIAVDGEGIGRGRQHKYVLLGVGKEQVEAESGLTFDMIARFLYEQYTKIPGAAFVGFFLGYDFTQWFKTLPEGRARVLLTEPGRVARQRNRSGGNRTPFAVSYGEWEFDILGMKRFKLRPVGEKGWMYICDAGSFFQTSLMNVIDPKKWEDPVVVEDEYATLEEGKRKRDSAQLDSDMRRYNVLENDVLSRLMARLNEGFTQAGIRLKKDQWFGPGQAAQEWLSMQHGVPTTILLSADTSTHDRGIRNFDVFELGRMTYYGGWFEIFAHGHIPGYSYEYDINSAYPYIISRLPCLLHGQWTSGHGTPPPNTERGLTIACCRVVGSDKRIGAALHRLPDGTIRRPNKTRGYYWRHELDAAVRAGLIDSIEWEEWWSYEPCDCPSPLRGVVGLYDHRNRVGKNTSAGKSYKLIYNSMYGKFAQSVGHPKYGNSIYASLITAGCRTMILDAIATHPGGSNAVLMVATDGVYFNSRHPDLSLSTNLGDWEKATHKNLTLFKPGIYWDDDARGRISKGDSPNFKSRGINAAEFAKSIAEIDDLFGQWDRRYPVERDPDGPREGWFPKIKFTSGFSMITCQQALQRGKWFLAGAVGDAELTQDADPFAKRHDGYYDAEHDIYWSAPYEDVFPETSTPYKKEFGMVEDPELYGIAPEGYVLDQWKGLLRA